MTVEVSTVNELLGLSILLQAWIVRKLFSLQTKVSIILNQCQHCKQNRELDTDRLTKSQIKV